MDISQALDIIEKQDGWFRLEHLQMPTATYVGFPSTWVATFSAWWEVDRTMKAQGATALEALVALVRKIEKAEAPMPPLSAIIQEPPQWDGL